MSSLAQMHYKYPIPEVREVMEESRPRLSVVAVSRNDDHGINLHRRMQTFVNAFIAQCQRHELHAELILVEWNPPADRPRLAQSLNWPADPSPCEVRIIEVPAHLHQRYKCASSLPLFQMIGKNVGIRRARGEFILCTNIDILLNDELMRFLKFGPLEKGKYYRIDRTDVGADVPVDASVDQQLDYCRNTQIRINHAFGSHRLDRTGKILPDNCDIVQQDCGIDLKDGWFALETGSWGVPYRWVDEYCLLGVTPPPGPARRLKIELFPGPGTRWEPFELHVCDERGHTLAFGDVPARRSLVLLDLQLPENQHKLLQLRVTGGGARIPGDSRALNFGVHRLAWDREGSGGTTTPFRALRLSRCVPGAEQGGPVAQGMVRLVQALVSTVQSLRTTATGIVRTLLEHSRPRASSIGLAFIPPQLHTNAFIPPQLHTNACGDFTLMAREHWEELRGYAEFDAYSFHIDSLLCYAAHYSGIREYVLPPSMQAYHIDHSAGSGWSPEGENLLFDRLRRLRVPVLSNEDLHRWVEQMAAAGHGKLFNAAGWGLADEYLEETRMGASPEVWLPAQGQEPQRVALTAKWDRE